MKKIIYLILSVLFIFGFCIKAEALTLSDFFIYQDDAGSSTLHDRNTLTGGFIGSNNDVKIHNDNSTKSIMGGGDLTLHDRNNITGDATFDGSVTLGVANTITGTTSANGVPNSFVPISLPTPTVFSTGGSNVTTGGLLTPGSYGDLTQGGVLSLNLTSGNYYFDQINLNNGNVINLNLSSGAINIYVTGDFDLHDSNNFIITGGSASNVYTEVHGKWNFHNDNTWGGTVYAPNDFIKFHDGNNINGALYSGTFVDIHDDNTLIFSPVSPSNTAAAPEPSTIFLLGLGFLGARRFKKELSRPS